MDTKKIAEDNKIMECYSGSHAYGTSIPESDVDYRGLFVAPRIYTTPFHTIEQYTAPKPEDRVLYEVSKFMKLVADQNPNIIELLWVDDEDIHFRTPVYDYLRSQREMLLSSKCKYTYSGYAHAQIKKMKTKHSNIRYHEEFNELMLALSSEYKAGTIDEEFIIVECGDEVLRHMKSNGLLCE